jgi:ATP-binding cassette, subfamily C, bacterial CydC
MTRLWLGRCFGVLSQLSGIALLLVSSWLIVRAAEHPPVLYLMVGIVSVRFFGLARAALRYVERLLTHDAAFTMVTQARTGVYRELDRVAPAGMSRHRRGDLVSRVVSDVDAILDQVLRLRTPWVVALSSTAVVVIAVGLVQPLTGLVVGAGAAIAMIGIRVVVPWSSRATDVAGTRGILAAEVSQAVLAAPDLIAAGATGPVLASVRTRVRALAALQRRAAWSSGLGSAVVLVTTGISIALVAAVSGGVDPVLVGVLVLAPLALAEPLESLADAERLRPQIASARARLAELAEVPDPVREPIDTFPLPARFDLVIRDLAVGWTDTVAAGISFDLPEGGAIAVTGPSGSGKSTLALTLARLIEARAGSVLLGGIDTRELRSVDVRTRIGYVGQDEVVFDTTIRENLRIADPTADDEQLLTALAAAGLGRFVADLPRGLDTPVGERGDRLSGGERQRLCLARLLLADHRILVLDEPTEHLDRPAAQALLRDVLALRPGRSVVVVSHVPWVLEAIGRVVRMRPPVPDPAPRRPELELRAHALPGGSRSGAGSA